MIVYDKPKKAPYDRSRILYGEFEKLDYRIYLLLASWIRDYSNYKFGHTIDLQSRKEALKLQKFVKYINVNYGKYVKDYYKTKPKRNVVRKVLKDKNIKKNYSSSRVCSLRD